MWCKCQVSFTQGSFLSWIWSGASFLWWERITRSTWYWISLSFHFESFNILRGKHTSKLFPIDNIFWESKWLCIIGVFSKERGFCFSLCSGFCLNGVQPPWHLTHFHLYVFNDRMVVVFCLKSNIELLIEPIPCREILLSIGLDTQWLMMLPKIVWIFCIECERYVFKTFVFTVKFCLTVFYTSWAH